MYQLMISYNNKSPIIKYVPLITT